MTLGQLRMLVEVGELGSFSGAARALGRSQPGVSQAIAALEEELGVTLVRRARFRVTLTEAGLRVAGHARAALRSAEEIRATASAARGIDRGKLRLGVLSSAAATILPALVRVFGARHPGMELRILRGSDEEVRACRSSEPVRSRPTGADWSSGQSIRSGSASSGWPSPPSVPRPHRSVRFS
ncbi:MAG TPA: LysR family transcriptional regulator, partial [Myxococcaceae bacterium]|nr:LysR family transcriptional regulator [Myxococcaceae bacterium]